MKRHRDVCTARTGEAGGERRAVLDCLRSALSHERQHRMAGIAEERRAPNGPAFERRPVEQRQDGHLIDRGDDGAYLGVPAVELGKRGRDVDLVGP